MVEVEVDVEVLRRGRLLPGGVKTRRTKPERGTDAGNVQVSLKTLCDEDTRADGGSIVSVAGWFERCREARKGGACNCCSAAVDRSQAKDSGGPVIVSVAPSHGSCDNERTRNKTDHVESPRTQRNG